MGGGGGERMGRREVEGRRGRRGNGREGREDCMQLYIMANLLNTLWKERAYPCLILQLHLRQLMSCEGDGHTSCTQGELCTCSTHTVYKWHIMTGTVLDW